MSIVCSGHKGNFEGDATALQQMGDRERPGPDGRRELQQVSVLGSPPKFGRPGRDMLPKANETPGHFGNLDLISAPIGSLEPQRMGAGQPPERPTGPVGGV